MAGLIENTGRFVVLVVLLVFSGIMSGSETAYFNLSYRQVQGLIRSTNNKFAVIAAKLLQNPKRLLSSLLLGNMTVNVLYFAQASVLSVNLQRTHGNTAAALNAIVVFFALLLFGEMLPKSIAYSNSLFFSKAVAPVCYLFSRVFFPFVKLFDIVVVEPSIRLLLGISTKTKLRKRKTIDPLTVEQFKFLIETFRQQGLIGEDENQMLTEVIELGFIKVRNVMIPRVDVVFGKVHEPLDELKKRLLNKGMTKMPLCRDELDNIVGMIHLRDIILNPDTEPENLCKKANYVPEQKTVESLLDYFRKNGLDTSLVVDEYGGIAGLVTVERVVEELFGPIESTAETEPIEQVGPLKYRLSGNVAIHEWASLFGIDPGQNRLTTMSGLVTALLGRIPQPGDNVSLANLDMQVEKVSGNRITSILLSLKPHAPRGEDER